MGRKLQDEIEDLFKAAAASTDLDPDAAATGAPPDTPSHSGAAAKKRKMPAANAPSGLPRAFSAAGASAPPDQRPSSLTPRGLSITRSGSLAPSKRGAPFSPGATGASSQDSDAAQPRTKIPTQAAPPPRTVPSAEVVAETKSARPEKPGGPPAPAKRTTASRARRTAKDKGSGRREPVPYAGDEPAIDHKGRSKPLYKPRTPRPRTWRPTKKLMWLLGAFPGARMMASESVRWGAIFATFGLIVVVFACFLVIGWSQTVGRLRGVQIDDRWILPHAGIIVALVALFELLRLGSAFAGRTSPIRGPRVLASLLLPSCSVLWLAPEVVEIWPRLAEAALFSAAVLAAGGLVGTVWCFGDGTLSTPQAQKKFRIAGASFLSLLLALGFATGLLGAAPVRQTAAVARAHGFEALAGALGRIGDLAP